MPPERESRPVGNGPAQSISTAIKTETTLRRRWAYSLIRRSMSPVPTYGSQAWIELPEGSAEKIASVVVAAEAWAMDGDDLVDDLHRELDERRRIDKALDDDDYQARAADHRKRWRHLSLAAPSRYAGQPVRPLEDIGADYTAATSPRSGDSPGRGSA